MTEPAKRRLLLVFAHPDDESVFAGGVACGTVAERACVALCTATPGEQGKLGDPPMCPRERLGAVRQAELMAACTELGIRTVRVLGSRTAGWLRRQPTPFAASSSRSFEPCGRRSSSHFDPTGSNLHPDHVAISRFTSDAVAAAGGARWFPDLGTPHVVTRVLWTLPVTGP